MESSDPGQDVAPGLPPGLADRYRPERTLGKGGFGTVVLAEDRNLGRKVAIKVLRDLGGDARIRDRFLREAKVTAGLQHPAIVRVFDYGIAGEVPYIVYEYLSGTDLGPRVKAGPVEPGEVARIGRVLAEALSVAHAQGVVHRDVKPENVLLRPDGEPVLCDFGVARTSSEGTMLTAEGFVLGTPAYMAPEALMGRPADPACDQFSLGALLYELATGKPVYGSHKPGEILGRLSPGVGHGLGPGLGPGFGQAPGLPRELATVLAKALSERPEDRYPDLAAMRDGLSEAIPVTGPRSRPEVEDTMAPGRTRAIVEPAAGVRTEVRGAPGGSPAGPTMRSPGRAARRFAGAGLAVLGLAWGWWSARPGARPSAGATGTDGPGTGEPAGRSGVDPDDLAGLRRRIDQELTRHDIPLPPPWAPRVRSGCQLAQRIAKHEVEGELSTVVESLLRASSRILAGDPPGDRPEPGDSLAKAISLSLHLLTDLGEARGLVEGSPHFSLGGVQQVAKLITRLNQEEDVVTTRLGEFLVEAGPGLRRLGDRSLATWASVVRHAGSETQRREAAEWLASGPLDPAGPGPGRILARLQLEEAAYFTAAMPCPEYYAASRRLLADLARHHLEASPGEVLPILARLFEPLLSGSLDCPEIPGSLPRRQVLATLRAVVAAEPSLVKPFLPLQRFAQWPEDARTDPRPMSILLANPWYGVSLVLRSDHPLPPPPAPPGASLEASLQAGRARLAAAIAALDGSGPSGSAEPWTQVLESLARHVAAVGLAAVARDLTPEEDLALLRQVLAALRRRLAGLDPSQGRYPAHRAEARKAAWRIDPFYPGAPGELLQIEAELLAAFDHPLAPFFSSRMDAALSPGGWAVGDEAVAEAGRIVSRLHDTPALAANPGFNCEEFKLDRRGLIDAEILSFEGHRMLAGLVSSTVAASGIRARRLGVGVRMATVCDRMDPRDVAGILEDLVELRRLGSAQHHLGFSELCEATRRMPVPARSQGAEIVLRVLDACADL